MNGRLCKRVVLVAAAALALGGATEARADDFDAGSYIIPMDLDYQDEGMLRAYGLVYALLLNDVPVRWTIREGKVYGEEDFTADAFDVASGMPVTGHDYRGGPFVVDALDAMQAQAIIDDWLAEYPETAVHEADAPFSAEVSRYLVVAPTIAMVADGNEDIARSYMQAAAIPDSELSLDWGNDSPDMLDTDELAGPTDTDHADGALFDEDGNPVYCQLMSMHWDVGDAEAQPEVVAEVRAYLNNPVHFFAECQAVNAFENLDPHGFFLTPNGFLIGDRPDELDFLHMDSPFGQIHGSYETVGGSEPAYSLPKGDEYKAGDITMLTEAGTPEGVNDVWMTGFLDGACPPDQHECGTIGKVSYLGGHEYSTDTPISANPDTQGTRMFLNSLFEAPCATVEGLPTIGLAVDAPEQTTEPAITLSITYSNTSFINVLDVTLTDTLPPGATFVSASDGGTLEGDTVTWDLGNLGPEEAGDVTIEVQLDDFGTYLNSAQLDYRVGLNWRDQGSNTSETLYGDDFPEGTSGGLDGTAGGSGVGDDQGDSGNPGSADETGTGTGATDGATVGLEDPPATGCSCQSSGEGDEGLPWLWGGLMLLGVMRRRRRLAMLGAASLGLGCSGGGSGTSGSDTDGLSGLSTTGTMGSLDADDTAGKLDTPPPSDVPFNPGTGCQKIDFLFVIDSSESMKDHQTNLVDSFPGFVDAMQEAVPADDWHVMVVDTDGQWNGADCANACSTLGSCPDEPAFSCDVPAPELCDITMGAGEVAPYGEGASNEPCELGSGRFVDAGHPDLDTAFSCAARVGVDGSSLEHTAQSLTRAVSSELLAEHACNEGFLRDDAILVVTLITDEPDEVSEDEPPAWHDALVAAKNEDESAVVILGLLPDGDAASQVCDDPVPAPRLGALLDAFPASTRASVCEPDYSPFLAAAVEVIAETCDGFEPPG
ncbi:MAG: MYXO-CTERM sorting domain-containing protein [Myxococcota bacterium]